MAEPPAFYFYKDNIESVKLLSDEAAGKLLKGMIDFFFFERTPDLDDTEGLKYIWPIIKKKLENDRYKYRLECAKRAYAADMRTLKKDGIEYTYAAWFQWRTMHRKKDYQESDEAFIDPLLDKLTIEDMLILDSTQAYKKQKHSRKSNTYEET